MLWQFQADCEAYLECMQSVPASIETYGSNKDDYRRGKSEGGFDMLRL